jgi:hypothetical protein
MPDTNEDSHLAVVSDPGGIQEDSLSDSTSNDSDSDSDSGGEGDEYEELLGDIGELTINRTEKTLSLQLQHSRFTWNDLISIKSYVDISPLRRFILLARNRLGAQYSIYVEEEKEKEDSGGSKKIGLLVCTVEKDKTTKWSFQIQYKMSEKFLEHWLTVIRTHGHDYETCGVKTLFPTSNCVR